jgi:hypothetical protein
LQLEFDCRGVHLPDQDPGGVRTGTSNRYTITAAENPGSGFVKVSAVGKGGNPEAIHFR